MQHINQNFLPSNVRTGRAQLAAALETSYNVPETLWNCCLCFEKMTPGRPVILHSCTKHWYHLLCLSRVEEGRCPLCRADDYTGYEHEPHNRIRPQVSHIVSENNELCTFCRQLIPQGINHTLLPRCRHHAHINCLAQSVLNDGVSVLGVPYCRTCLH